MWTFHFKRSPIILAAMFVLFVAGCNSEFSETEEAMRNAATLKDKLPHAMRLCEIDRQRAIEVIKGVGLLDRDGRHLPYSESGEFDLEGLEMAHTLSEILGDWNNPILYRYLESKTVEEGLMKYHNILGITGRYFPHPSAEDSEWFDIGRASFAKYMPPLSAKKVSGATARERKFQLFGKPKHLLVYSDGVDMKEGVFVWRKDWYIDFNGFFRKHNVAQRCPSGLNDIDILITVKQDHNYIGYYIYGNTGQRTGEDAYETTYEINAYDFRSGRFIRNIAGKGSDEWGAEKALNKYFDE